MTAPRRRRRRRVKLQPGESTVINRRGGSHKWTRMTAEVVRREPLCWLRLPGCTIRSTTADHYYPRKTHRHLSEDMNNLRGACLPCNRARGDTPLHKLPELRARLERKRRPPPALGFFNRGGTT